MVKSFVLVSDFGETCVAPFERSLSIGSDDLSEIETSTRERNQFSMSRVYYADFDTHKESIAVGVAEEGGSTQAAEV